MSEKEILLKSFGQLVRTARTKQDMKQIVLAKLIGFRSESTIHYVESGKLKIHRKYIPILAEVLSLDLSVLAGIYLKIELLDIKRRIQLLNQKRSDLSKLYEELT